MQVEMNYFLRVQQEAKKCKDKLTEKAAQILLSLDIPALNKRGIKRATHLYEIFNQYPPFSLLKNISEKEIFLNNNPLEQAKEGEPLSLYVHTPFCIKKCIFCCYFTVQGCSKSNKEDYISILKKEIKLLLKKRYLQFRKISSMYWGGGTPTLLNERQITDLMFYLKDNFEITPNAEICCETTPEEAKMRKLECLIKNGFNRLSIGVQTFDDDLLRLYNRLHTGKEAINAFKMSQKAGFNHINIDLMFGLSGQTIRMWKRNLEIAEVLRPTNVTTYPFSFVNAFGGLIISKRLKKHLPSEEERLLMHAMAIEKFVGNGYIQITPYQFISSRRYSFRQQEFKAKNGENYGFGASARSFINNVEFRKRPSLLHYYQALEQDKFPVVRGRRLDRKEQMIKFFIGSLEKTSGINRKEGGVDKTLFQRMFGLSVNEAFKEELTILKNLGLISESDCYIHFTYLGLLYPTETSLLFYLKKDRDKIANPKDRTIE